MNIIKLAAVEKNKFPTYLLLFVLAVFVSLAVAYSFSVPVFESQDEEHHLDYINYFAQRYDLPDLRKTEDLKAAGCQVNQTPFYYFFNGLLLRAAGYRHITIDLRENPFRSAATPALYFHGGFEERFPYSRDFRIVHLLRLLNVVTGVFILIIIYKSLQLLPFQNRSFAVLGTAFVALIPQFTYICGSVNNDAFNILFSSLAAYFLMKFLLAKNASLKYVTYMSVALGIGVLSKQLVLSLLPPFSLALLIKGTNRQKAKNIIAFSLITSVLIGWYYARNLILFHDPFSVKVMAVLAPNLIQEKSLIQLYDYFWSYFVRYFIKSFWGSFGYMTVDMQWVSYLFYNVIAGTGLIAFATGIMDGEFRNRFSKEHKIILAILLLTPFIMLAEILSFNMTHSQPQGRYGFGLLICLAIFWGLGMDRLIRAKQTHADAFCFFLIIAFAFINLQAVGGTLRSAFPPLPEHIDAVQREADGNLGEMTNKTLIGQIFHCNDDGLDTVAVLLTTFGRYNNSHIVFHLRDLADPTTDLVTQKIAANDLRDNTFHLFRFPPLKQSSGRNYLFLLESPDAKEGQAISCFYAEKDLYPAGNAILNNGLLKGDLAFITGCS